MDALPAYMSESHTGSAWILGSKTMQVLRTDTMFRVSRLSAMEPTSLPRCPPYPTRLFIWWHLTAAFSSASALLRATSSTTVQVTVIVQIKTKS